MSTQPYPQQSYPMETYPGYREPPQQPPQPPRGRTSGLKGQAQIGIIFGVIICIVGGYAMIRRECTSYFLDVCLEVGYPYAAAGIMAIIVGIVIIVLSVVAVLFAYKQEASPQPLSVGSPCPICNGPMVWIPQYQRWFCQHCQKYS